VFTGELFLLESTVLQDVSYILTLTGKDGRNKYVQLLTDLGARFKKQKWGWLWAPALALSELEKAVNVGGFGYPVRQSIICPAMLFQCCFLVTA